MRTLKRFTLGQTVRLAIIASLSLLVATPVMGQDADPVTTEEPVAVSSYGTVNMAVKDADLVQILEMLSIQGQRNIIAGRDVSATVTANLYDVTFEEALDAILRVNGYGYVEEGSFIYVYPTDQIDAIKASLRTLETRIFELYYLNAVDATKVVAPLLSEAGNVVSLGTVEEGFNPDELKNGADSYAYAAKIVVTDYPDRLEKVAEVIKNLDLSPKQVMVEATILQTTVDENNAFGIDFSIVSHLNFEQIVGGPLAAASGLFDGSISTHNAIAGTSTVGNSVTGNGGFKMGVVKDDFGVFLRALDKVTDVTVVARPKVMCLNRQRAEILVGERLGYLSTTQTETSTTQTVEFLDTGIHLMFRPFITPNDMIRMELYPRLSSGSYQNLENFTVPKEDAHEIFTNVRVKNGETIVLGGLFKEQTVMDREQVPILGDIPILGAAFRGQDDRIERVEIIFLLTPTIIADERLWEMGEDGLEIVDTVQVGARAGLLPFSRDQITADYNRDAIKAYRNGDLDLALYYANNSLRTSSVQPEMIRLRDSLTSSSRKAWERSINRRLLDKEMAPRESEPGHSQSGSSDTSSSIDLPTLKKTSGTGFGSTPVTVVDTTE